VKQKLLVIALLVVLVPGLLWALALMGLTLLMRSEISRGRATLISEAALTAPLIASSKALLRGDPLLADAPEDGADAAPVLDPLVHWGDEPRTEWRVHPRKTNELFLKWSTGWPSHAGELDPDEAARDLGYMAELPRYARWSFPVRAATKTRWATPLLDEFGFDAKLRLLRGIRDGKPEQAAAEVCALARLLIHSEDHHALIQGMWITRLERSAYDAYVASGATPLPTWQPWSKDQSNALRVLALSTASALDPLAPDTLAADALADLPAPIRCACQALSIQSLALVRDRRDPDLLAPLDRAKGWLAQPAGCRFTTARARWDHGDLLRKEDFDSSLAPIQAAMDLIPFSLLRPVTGTAFLLRNGSTSAWSAYRAARTSPK
jgi:hypothetical protein